MKITVIEPQIIYCACGGSTPPHSPSYTPLLLFMRKGKLLCLKGLIFVIMHTCWRGRERERERGGLHRLKKRRRNVLRKMEERKREDCFYNKLKMKDTKIELCIKTNKNVKFK